MTMSLRRRVALVAALVAALATTLIACGGDGGDEGDDGQANGSTSTTAQAGGMTVSPASYDLVAGTPQRFIAGVFFDDGKLLSFGSVDLAFGYLGTRENPLRTPRAGPTAEAAFLPVPGEDAPDEGRPRKVEPSVARGVYGAYDIVFDTPGYWGVVLRAEVDGKKLEATAAFTVNAEHATPAPGDSAPTVEEPVAGAPGVQLAAVDSRAAEGDLPDPSLHATTVRAALASGKPVMVVVATPVYCKSRFCGPVTDAVEELGASWSDRAAFVHIEVWEDFKAQKVNPAAAAWMAKKPGGDMQEPWVFLVKPDGTISHRWDNVATEAELEAGLREVAGA